MKTKISKIGLFFFCGMFFAACGASETKEVPAVTERPKPIILEPATPTPTITAGQEVPPEAAITSTLTPKPTATSTPVPTSGPTRKPTPTVKPTATPEPVKPVSTGYQKGILTANGFESKWLGIKFLLPDGVELYSQEELDETMRLLEEAMYGELPEGDLPYEELALVYEMSAVWQAEGLLMQVIVERPADKSISAEEYAEQIRDDLNILDGSNVTYLVDDRFYSADISGQEFINFGYTTYYDEGISLRQENYIKKQDDRIIVINITGADATENGMQRLLDSFVPYEN